MHFPHSPSVSPSRCLQLHYPSFHPNLSSSLLFFYSPIFSLNFPSLPHFSIASITLPHSPSFFLHPHSSLASHLSLFPLPSFVIFLTILSNLFCNCSLLCSHSSIDLPHSHSVSLPPPLYLTTSRTLLIVLSPSPTHTHPPQSPHSLLSFPPHRPTSISHLYPLSPLFTPLSPPLKAYLRELAPDSVTVDRCSLGHVTVSVSCHISPHQLISRGKCRLNPKYGQRYGCFVDSY